jgi:hypothetical protein
MKIPCGQCVGCRLERSRQWAIRCIHEAQLYEKNCFITLTYNEDKLPESGSLVLEDFQKFLKRLRKKRFGEKIRYYMCGEYGDKNKRPHYHACMFNLDFEDKIELKNRDGQVYYTSQELQSLWPYGFSLIGDVTFESAAYVARYILKKVTGGRAIIHYNDIDFGTGEILRERKAEFTTMSRRPGIGKGWLEKYWDDVFPDDFVVVRGKQMRVPKYYLNSLEEEDPFGYDDLKEIRRRKSVMLQSDNTYERLLDREELTKIQLKEKQRRLENET